MNVPDHVIDEACAGLTQGAAKVRYLRGLGLTVRTKPNGQPLVTQAHYDEVMGTQKATTTKQNKRPVVPRGFNWSVPA